MNKLLTSLVFLAFAASANATTITYSDWVYSNPNAEVEWLVTIDDTSNADYFTFTLDIVEGSVEGDMFGFGFDTDIDFGPDYLNLIENYSTTTFGTCSFICNWNNTGAEDVEYTLAIGGTGSDYVTSFSFGLPSNGVELTADTFSLVAIRAAQIDGNGGPGGFAKDYSVSASAVAVPELNGSLSVIILALVATALMLVRGRKESTVAKHA